MVIHSSLNNLTITGVPAGVTFNTGTLSGGTLTLTPAQLKIGRATGRDSGQGNVTLHVTATTTEGSSTATSTCDITVTVNPVAEAPTLTVANSSFNEDTAVELSS